jgi:hypothetical protein
MTSTKNGNLRRIRRRDLVLFTIGSQPPFCGNLIFAEVAQVLTQASAAPSYWLPEWHAVYT